MDDEKPRNPDADLEMDVAVNTQLSSENFRKMGFEGAADTLHNSAHEIASKAVQDGWVEPARQRPDLPPGWEQEGDNPPHPATTMGPISKEDEERAIEYTKHVEEVRRSLGESDPPHADPHVQTTPIGEGDPPPPIFD
jgi:hypothetical protein